MANNLVAEIAQHLASKHMHPTQAWLQSVVPSLSSNAPLQSKKQTALFRLLATDITRTLHPASSVGFPSDIHNGQVSSRALAGPIICQVLDIEDIGLSRWAQVEQIEAQERGEMTKGREIVRVIEDDGNNAGGTVAPAVQSKGPFKLLLQDAKGTKVYAVDLRGIGGLNTGISMGTKILLANAQVRRAVIMLESSSVQMLGGKIEALDKAWKEGRKERLIASAGAAGQPAG